MANPEVLVEIDGPHGDWALNPEPRNEAAIVEAITRTVCIRFDLMPAAST